MTEVLPRTSSILPPGHVPAGPRRSRTGDPAADHGGQAPARPLPPPPPPPPPPPRPPSDRRGRSFAGARGHWWTGWHAEDHRGAAAQFGSRGTSLSRRADQRRGRSRTAGRRTNAGVRAATRVGRTFCGRGSTVGIHCSSCSVGPDRGAGRTVPAGRSRRTGADFAQVATTIPPWPHGPDGPHIDGITPCLDDGTPGTFSMLAGLWLTAHEEPDHGNLYVWPGTRLRLGAYLAEHGADALTRLDEMNPGPYPRSPSATPSRPRARPAASSSPTTCSHAASAPTPARQTTFAAKPSTTASRPPPTGATGVRPSPTPPEVFHS